MGLLLKIFSNKHSLPFIIIIFVAILAGRTLIFQSGYFNMHDDLQMMRQLEMEKCFLDCQIPCRWVSDMGYGYGFPLFNFYPPLPYLMGQGIRILGYSFITTVKLTFFLSILVSGISMYLLSKEFFGRLGGLLSSIFYIWVPYRAVDIFVRGAMNESWALAWFPLIFWASYRLLKNEDETKSLRGVQTTKQSQRLKCSLPSLVMIMGNKWVVGLSLSWFALLTSHNLMVFIFTPVFIGWILILLWYGKKWKKVPHLIISGIWALGLASFFTLPALLENQFTRVKTVIEGYFEFSGHFINLQQLFISRFWDYGGSAWGITNDGMSFSIGHLHWILSLLVGFIIAVKIIIVIARIGKTKQSLNSTRSSHFVLNDKDKNAVKSFKKDPILLSICYMLLIGWFSAFLTHGRSTFIWLTIPQLKYLQFPWRFLSIVIFAFSFVVGYLVSSHHFGKGFFAKLALSLSNVLRMTVTIILIILIVAVNFNFFTPKGEEMGPLTDQEKFSGEAWRLQQKAGIMDYLPKTVKKEPDSARTTLAEVMNGQAEIEKPEQGSYWVLFNINVDSEEAKVRINIIDFPGWRVFDKNVELKKYLPEEEEWGRMWINLSKGEHQIYAQFMNTPIRTIGNIISILSWLAIISLLLRQRFKFE